MKVNIYRILFVLVLFLVCAPKALSQDKGIEPSDVSRELSVIEQFFAGDLTNLTDNFHYVTIIKNPKRTWLVFSTEKPKTRNDIISFRNPCLYFVYNDKTRQWYYKSKSLTLTLDDDSKVITIRTSDLLKNG